MDPRNYMTWTAYRQEYREVLRDKHDAERLLGVLERAGGITADDILREAGSGGRLTLTTDGPYNEGRFGCRVSYCTGQYFATEYRKAVARLAAAVLWAHVREHCMPTPCAPDGSFSEGATREHYPFKDGGKYHILSAGDWLRAHFKREFGRRLAARYFD